MAPQIFLSNNSSSSVNINATKNPTFQHITAAASTSTVDQIFADGCNSIVERFRRGELDKYTAYFLLAKAAICDNPKDTERLLSKVAPILPTLDREVGIALTPSVKRAHQHQGGREQVGAKANALLVNRREFQHLEEETPGYPAKRQRMMVELDLSNLVHPDNNRRLTEISPSLQRTVDVLASWSTDVKEVKRRFINHPGCPEFPHTEWDNIIAGRPVDLGVVLSDDGRSQTVTTSSDWIRAWMRLAKAYRFAFPRRTEELRAYEEYIINKFDSSHVPYHFRVINFDKAVRKRVGSRRDLELSDFQKFEDLDISYFHQMGGTTARRKWKRTLTPRRGLHPPKERSGGRRAAVGTPASAYLPLRYAITFIPAMSKDVALPTITPMSMMKRCRVTVCDDIGQHDSVRQRVNFGNSALKFRYFIIGSPCILVGRRSYLIFPVNSVVLMRNSPELQVLVVWGVLKSHSRKHEGQLSNKGSMKTHPKG